MSASIPGKLIVVGDNGEHRATASPVCTNEDWTVCISGEVNHPQELNLSELWSLPLSEWDNVDVTCVSVNKIYRPVNARATFTGVFLRDLAEHVGLKRDAAGQPVAKTVRFVSKAPGACGPADQLHETALDLEHCLTDKKVMIVGSINGAPLPYENGGPARTVVADRYFYKSVKWLGEIQFLNVPVAECRGTWERYAGYHNVARVAQQERFEPFFKMVDEDLKLQDVDDPARKFDEMLAAGDLSRLVAAKLDLVVPDLKQKLKGREDLRFTASANDREVTTALRGTDLSGCDFRGWSLAGVNFSLSRFIESKLAGADLRGCDFEGAVLWGADLSNADATGACFGGAELYKASGAMAADVKGLNVGDASGLEPEVVDWLVRHGAYV